VISSTKNEMGGTCCTYGGKEEVHIGFWWGNLSERGNFEDVRVDGRILLKYVFKK
jgi:hypothetical protein